MDHFPSQQFPLKSYVILLVLLSTRNVFERLNFPPLHQRHEKDITLTRKIEKIFFPFEIVTCYQLFTMRRSYFLD